MTQTAVGYVASSPGGDALRAKAIKVFQFLTEFQRLRTRIIRTLDSYRSVLWLGELPDGPSITLPVLGQDTGTWLTVDRVERLSPPTPPQVLAGWIANHDLRDSRLEAPVLSARSMRVVPVIHEDGTSGTVTEEQLLEDHPEVEDALRVWLPTWLAWAVDDRTRAAAADSYQYLYWMYQDARALAETYELVLGFGLLTSRSGGQDVRRHVLIGRVVIDLDLESGRLSLGPAPDGFSPVLEQDMLDPADTVPEAVRESIRSDLHLLADPWQQAEELESILRSWTNAASADAVFSSSMRPVRARTDHPALTSAPAIILRERTQRSFIAACDTVISRLEAGEPVPSGVRQFIEITDGAAPADEQALWDNKYEDEETYFPKASNDEQRQIVKRLAHKQTVVVQGPPGTGKTHTIANLVTDLLAHGQRVLITSTTTRALSVLRDQLPDEVRDLCVSVTDDAARGQADLERSVATILSASMSWNTDAEGRRAARLRQELARSREAVQRALSELRQIREVETFEYSADVGTYVGTLQSIADRLRQEEPALSWVGAVSTDSPALSSRALRRYVELRRAATPTLRSCAGVVPDLTALPDPTAFDLLTDKRTQALSEVRALHLAEVEPLARPLRQLNAEARQDLRRVVDEYAQRRDTAATLTRSWATEALQDVVAGRGREWRAQSDLMQAELQRAQALLAAFQAHDVSGLDVLTAGDSTAAVSALLAHLEAGKKLRGVFGRARVAKDYEHFLSAVKVDGQVCETSEQLSIVEARLAFDRALDQVELPTSQPAASRSPQRRLARLEDDAAQLAIVLAVGQARTALEDRLSRVPHLPPLDWAAGSDLQLLPGALDLIAREELRDQTEATVDPAVRALVAAQGVVGVVEPVGEALEALRSWDVQRYRTSHALLVEAAEATAVLDELDIARVALEAGAPELEQSVARTFEDAVWDSRCARLPEAWAWSVWDARVRDKADPTSERRWREELSSAERASRSLLKQLGSNRGWAACLERLSPRESTHLNMYAQAVRKAGKGTGKYVERHRAAARESLRRAQSAVPAWIMPMHRVFETVPVDRPNLFDVVIVDEASQSGLEGLLLTWLAPRLVVVGDDKQVSPSNVGLNHEAVYTLQDSFLSGVETKNLFGPTYSFFDQADSMSGSRIVLREHFRCMPEIIGFSNALCYRGALVPLRQYGAERLPPLRSTYVVGGMVSGGRDVLNEAEADALVEQVVKCCADPAYDGKTMGVITLLGNVQDKLILSRLVQTLGVREVEERRLRAGNAEAFQGDERHVIFMSMVSSLQSTIGPASIGVLSKESDQQRLNVAASRAQDQVWLFHSVQLGELSTKDLRRRYLQYVSRPPAEQDALDLGPVSPDERHDSFDSLFEQRVFLAIRERGYRVRPQVKVGRYAIDLVIEGGTQRLAVECDGDAYHGLAEQSDDAARQLDLQRVGWTFWRVRGSAFFRDPVGALDPLWRLLDDLNIEPAAPTDVASLTNITTEVQASPAPVLALQPVPARDAVPTRTGVHVVDELEPSPAMAPTPIAPVPGPAVPEPSRPPARFRNGRMLLTHAARARIEQEWAEIEAWLSSPPCMTAVDGRSAERQRAHLEELREERQDRAEYLQRVLAQSVVDESQAGGAWILPGCSFALRFGDDAEAEPYVVTSMQAPEGSSSLSPSTELAGALLGAQLGDEVAYASPRGPQVAHVDAIFD